MRLSLLQACLSLHTSNRSRCSLNGNTPTPHVRHTRAFLALIKNIGGGVQRDEARPPGRGLRCHLHPSLCGGVKEGRRDKRRIVGKRHLSVRTRGNGWFTAPDGPVRQTGDDRTSALPPKPRPGLRPPPRSHVFLFLRLRRCQTDSSGPIFEQNWTDQSSRTQRNQFPDWFQQETGTTTNTPKLY